ncbi:MAG TPA: helix-turn-helix transcriptional regulator [Fimbriimonas sp.]|nr:helix-turn-helix transcriptional regulator [Fimbriimonas sp.]
MQVSLVLHGTCCLQAGEIFVEMEAGDVATLRPAAKLEFRHCHALQLVTISFPPSMVRQGVAAMLDPRAVAMLMNAASAHITKLPSERFRSIAALLNSPSSSGQMGNLGRLLMLLEAVIESEADTVKVVHAAVQQTVDLFEQDLAFDWTLPELAARLDLDPSYLARLFRSAVGLPPLAYLAMLRAESAAWLLGEGQEPCAAVGKLVGWGDPNYFSRRFRQHFGESPTAYRDRVAASHASRTN